MIKELLTRKVQKALIEILMIMFLLYANVLMGFFTLSQSKSQSFVEALQQVLTWQILCIAATAAITAYFVIEWIRQK